MTDDIIQQILPSFGAFAPFAILAWWIISNQAADIKSKDERYRELVEKVIDMGKQSSQVMAELKAAIKGP